MAEAGTFSSILDPGIDYVFQGEFFNEDGSTIDLSTMTFIYTLRRNLDNVIVWNITNADFIRPTVSQIQFTKTSTEIRAMQQGNYTASLLVSGTGFIDGANRTFDNDEWLTGNAQR